MCMKEKFWERLVERIGLRTPARRPALSGPSPTGSRTGNAPPPDLARGVPATTPRRSGSSVWRGQVPIAPVYAVEEALADPQVAGRARWVVAVEHPRFRAGSARSAARSRSTGSTPRYAPAAPLGADTPAVLAEIGIGPGELEELRRRGVV